ncbi:TonB-dependent receptor [uncultured Mucilaginibacter sp.]|uniref:TonB-dependent receptor n=1 Tax=uncultured Mucilaginibacter sp. TaxID=797541 RepID=UPI00262F4165|nr:TonB-dependent receptor [uncultured Mucilaginibacter sp.]
MNKIYYKLSITFLLCLFTSIMLAQGIRGKITDASNGSTLPGVSVLIVGTQTGTATNENGEYSFKLAKGTYQLKVSFIGYQTITTSVTVDASFTTQNFSLKLAGSALNEVVVTGSRSAIPRTNIETTAPVDVISTKELRSFPQTDVSQILNYVAPSFTSNRQTISDGTDHIDPASLRGLGPDQVLVLVNGKRRHTSALVNINGTFGRGSVGTDLNAIPVAAIDHIEVLREGAAAQYGSDAIAGVINIVLKKVTPLNVAFSYGQSASSTLGRTFYDGKTYQIEGSKGWNLNGKGFVNIGAQYVDRGATNRSGTDTRPLLYSPLPSKGANETEANFETRYAGLKAADDAKAQANGLNRINMIVGNSQMKSGGFFANGQYTVAKWADVYADANYNRKNGLSAGFYRLPSQATQVDATIYPNGFLPFINTSINDLSFIGGVKGKIGNWNYDLSNTYGQNNISFDITNTDNASFPIGTSPTSFKAGKLVFNQNTVNFDVSRKFNFDGILTGLNTAYGAEYRIDNYQIHAGEEGSYSFGIPSQGITGRKVGSSFTAAGAQVFPGFQPSNALDKSRNNKSLYADYEADFGPRVLLEAAGRYENYSDFGSNFSYKLSGRVKVADELNIRGGFATGFRAPSLHQRYFNNVSTQFVNGNPTQVLTANNDDNIVRQFGVGSLKPEKSKDYSLGLTGKIANSLTYTIDAYQINIKDRIVFSSQYTRERDGNGNLIASGTVNQILNTVDPNAQINSVQFFTNAISTRTRGLDVVISDRISLNGSSNLVLSAAANVNQTKVTSINGSDKINGDQVLLQKLFNRTEKSRFETSVPASKINLSGDYTFKKFNVALRTVYFGKVTYLNSVDPNIASNNLPLGIDQTFSGKWVTDLSLGYKITKQLNFTVSASNLFDIYPDRLYMDPRNNQNNLSGNSANNYTTNRDNTSNGRFQYSAAVSQFGFNGRFILGKLTFTM